MCSVLGSNPQPFGVWDATPTNLNTGPGLKHCPFTFKARKEMKEELHKEAVGESWGQMTHIFDFTSVLTSEYWNLTFHQIRMFPLKTKREGRKKGREEGKKEPINACCYKDI